MFDRTVPMLEVSSDSVFSAPLPVIDATGPSGDPSPRIQPTVTEVSGRRTLFNPGRWRRFDLFVRDEHHNTFEGVGASLDDAIRYIQGVYADALEREANPDFHSPDSAGSLARSYGSVTVWEGDHCLAVFHPKPDGSAEVVRFDR